MKKAHSHRALLAILVIAGSMAAADAHEARTRLTVSATVNAVARLEVESAPAALDLSAADIRRGFIDVLQPTQLVVRSNSATGFTLEVMTVAPLISSMVIHGLGSDQFVGAEGGTLVQRWQNPGSASLSLQFRLVLVPGLAPGRYPWPMRVAVRPLETI